MFREYNFQDLGVWFSGFGNMVFWIWGYGSQDLGLWFSGFGVMVFRIRDWGLALRILGLQALHGFGGYASCVQKVFKGTGRSLRMISRFVRLDYRNKKLRVKIRLSDLLVL